MSDRKYRQRGYQDSGAKPARTGERKGPGPEGARPDRPPGAPAGTRRLSSEGAKNPRMMGYHEVAKCASCASPVDAEILSLSKCGRCGQALRSCVQCMHFDSGARLECTQPIPARVSPKDAPNDCPFFTPRTSWQRETSSASAPSSTSSAKKAFDDLFKI